MKEFTVACIQHGVVPMNPEANIARSIAMLQTAMDDHHPDLVVFPETITTGFHPNMPKADFWKLLPPVPGAWTEPLQRQADRHGVYVVWPVWEQGPEGVIYNTSVLIGPDGQIVGLYRKTHPFPAEREYTTPGNEAPVFELPFAKLGMVICYDGDFPELVRAMALKGAEVVVRPAALLRDYEIWSLTNRARAYDNQIHFVGVNSVGPDAAGNYYFGHSMIVDPCANILALARAGDQIISARLSPEAVKKSLVQHIPDRNTAPYAGVE